MRRLLLASLLCLLASLAEAQSLDLVILNGRVMDPESGLDAVRHIGIRAGKIAAISATPLTGSRRIDAKGLVVAPGFIDLHSHGQDAENYSVQARDGVTTALELEIGTGDVDAWYRQRSGKMMIHAGVSAGHPPARMKVMRDPSVGVSLVPSGDGARRPSTEEEITLMKQSVERGLQQGSIGVGFGIQYTPAASRWEILEMFRVAARFKAPAFVHIRHMGGAEPDALNAVEEVIAASAVTGTPLHIVHITSSGLRQTPKLLQTISEARARGMDITTECYPYNAAMTELNSAMFDEGWQKILGISYDKVEWTATGERLTEESFRKYRKMPGEVIMHMIPDNVVDLAVPHPLTIIASDGMLRDGKGHPRDAGTFTRVLGYYVREKQLLPLMEALRKMSLMPAQRLESIVPQMRNKGRIRVGADADLALFDPNTVRDQSTFAKPALPPRGMEHVIVAGVPVVTDGKVVEGVYPGQPVRAPR